MGGDEHALERGVRVLAEEEAILERPGLALGGVADHVLGRARVIAEAAPLGAGREPRAAAAAQARSSELDEEVVGGRRAGLAHGVGAGGRDVIVMGAKGAVGQQRVVEEGGHGDLLCHTLRA